MGSKIAILGGAYVLIGIAQGTKETVELVFDSASNAGEFSIRMTRSAFERARVSIGTKVEAVTESTGVVLVASGKVLAFVPNAVGDALLHNSLVPSGTTP